MSSTISGSLEAESLRQGVEINASAQVFSSIMPRLLPNVSPRIVVDGRPILDQDYYDESITTQLSSKKLELAPEHITEKRDLGYGKSHKDDTPYEDVLPFEPKTYVSEEDLSTKYPGNFESKSLIDPSELNGILEPFPIRAVSLVGNSENSKKVSGKIENFADDILGISSPIEQRVYYDGYQGAVRPYQEYFDNSERPIEIQSTYFADEPNVSQPWLDQDDSGLVASYLSDDELAAIVGAASGSFTKFGASFRSAGAGFVFNDTENGADSIAFLDRKSARASYSAMPSSSSLTPRQNRQRILKVETNTNIGFSDSISRGQNSPFDSNRVIEGSKIYYPANESTSSLVPGGKNQDISLTAPVDLIQRNLKTISDDITSPGFKDEISKEDLLLPDGTYAKSFIKIDVSTISASAVQNSDTDTNYHFAYAGRIDSTMAKNANSSLGYSSFLGSLFMSSALRDTNDFDSHKAPAGGFYKMGIAGTGFLYYSPSRRAWIEKRYNHRTSFGNNIRANERDDAINSIEINTWPHGTGTVPFLDSNDEPLRPSQVDDESSPRLASGSSSTDSYIYSTQLQLTGVNETLAQFTSSPQLGYFFPYREWQERFGYQNIGTPTTIYGAPFSPKYHAFDNETIKLKDYIDRPFLLRKVIVKIPVEIQHRHDMVSSSYTSDLGGDAAPRWTKDVTARKDIDNYTFFLYRQRRTKDINIVKDSDADISSSVRFLIASGSVSVYNGNVFGRAQVNDFYDYFGNSTPVTQSKPGGLFVTSTLDSLTRFALGSAIDPISLDNLTVNTGVLHSPAIAINVSMSLNDDTPSKRYFARGGLKFSMYPAVVLGGYPNPSMTYVTSSTGHYSSSFFVRTGSSYTSDDNSTNRLFNRYPYTGSFANITDADYRPPITTTVQHFWFGGTRQPIFNTNAYPSTSFAGAASNLEAVWSHYSNFYPDDVFFVTSESLQFRENYRDLSFDIEVARAGFSPFDNTSDRAIQFADGLVYDGRSIPVSLGRDVKPKPAGLFQRSSLIEFRSTFNESTVARNANFTIGHLSGSTLADLIASLTVGYSPAGPSQEQVLRDYILFPEDELVLGLDAGISPPPDIAPFQGKPMPDDQVGYNTDFSDTSSGYLDLINAFEGEVRRVRKIDIQAASVASTIGIISSEVGSDGISSNAVDDSGKVILGSDIGILNTLDDIQAIRLEEKKISYSKILEGTKEYTAQDGTQVVDKPPSGYDNLSDGSGFGS